MTVGRDAWRHLGPFLRPEEVCQGFRCRCTRLARGGATLEISLHPRLVASDVSISNWPGAGSAPLATDAEGRGNWEFDMVAAPGGACLFG